MKFRDRKASIIVLTFLFACDPPVTFTEPQPQNVKNIMTFPKRLEGKYMSLADSSTLVVESTCILRIYALHDQIHIEQPDGALRINADTLVDTQTNEKVLFRQVGDSLDFHARYIDTLFFINTENIVRKYKGHYFLNSRYDDNSWEVKKLSYSKRRLSIGRITTENEIEDLKQITDTFSDTIPPYQFSATKKHFRKFVRRKGFANIETFIRM